jgi:hypothetical protein
LIQALENVESTHKQIPYLTILDAIRAASVFGFTVEQLKRFWVYAGEQILADVYSSELSQSNVKFMTRVMVNLSKVAKASYETDWKMSSDHKPDL